MSRKDINTLIKLSRKLGESICDQGTYEERQSKHLIMKWKYKMEFQALYVLVTSMVLNFIVLGISLNRPDSFFPVSLSAIAISLQGFALRLIAINSVT